MPNTEIEHHAERYNERLRRCLAIIEGGFIGYPALKKMLETRSYWAMIRAIINDCLSVPGREWKPRHKDTEHVFVSSRYLSQKHIDIGASYSVWVDAIRLFACLGLLGVKHPTRKTANTSRERIAIEKAISKNAHSISFIWVDEYTPSHLTIANRRADKWLSWRRKARVSKADAITLFGKKIADSVFGDSRTISNERERTFARMQAVLEELLGIAPYTTQNAFKAMYGRGAGTAWINNSKIVMQRMGLVYRQQSKADKVQYHIPPEKKDWIIVKNWLM